MKGGEYMNGFIAFIRERGVVGLAVGFILGGAITRLVTSLVNDLVNPIVGIVMGRAEDLKKMYLSIGEAKIMWGSFITSFIDFLIIALVVYFGVKGLGLDKLDIKKDAVPVKKKK
jgi:large conductance mechanosensitive channel